MLSDMTAVSVKSLCESATRQNPKLRPSEATRWALQFNTKFAASADVSQAHAYTFGAKTFKAGVDVYFCVWKLRSRCSMARATTTQTDTGLLSLKVDTSDNGRTHSIALFASLYDQAEHARVEVRCHKVSWGFTSMPGRVLQSGTCTHGRGSLVVTCVRAAARQRHSKVVVAASVADVLAIEDAMHPCDLEEEMPALLDVEDQTCLDDCVAKENVIISS